MTRNCGLMQLCRWHHRKGPHRPGPGLQMGAMSASVPSRLHRYGPGLQPPSSRWAHPGSTEIGIRVRLSLQTATVTPGDFPLQSPVSGRSKVHGVPTPATSDERLATKAKSARNGRDWCVNPGKFQLCGVNRSRVIVEETCPRSPTTTLWASGHPPFDELEKPSARPGKSGVFVPRTGLRGSAQPKQHGSRHAPGAHETDRHPDGDDDEPEPEVKLIGSSPVFRIRRTKRVIVDSALENPGVASPNASKLTENHRNSDGPGSAKRVVHGLNEQPCEA